ncbi:hypothetical protein RIF29_24240 [Crotalaria pallida]|uniref:Uncharacterized protein n=1 Tax=Crotalaria pallida TaxID=3830 RepID=A0AAN9EJZ9_CROPI
MDSVLELRWYDDREEAEMSDRKGFPEKVVTHGGEGGVTVVCWSWRRWSIKDKGSGEEGGGPWRWWPMELTCPMTRERERERERERVIGSKQS